MPFAAKARLAMLVPNHQYLDAAIDIAVYDGIGEDLHWKNPAAIGYRRSKPWVTYQKLGDTLEL